jgi:hypothetical protein
MIPHLDAEYAETLSFDEIRSEGSNDICRSGQIVVDLDLPVCVVHFQQWFEALNAAVGKDNVDAAKLLLDSCCRFSQRLNISLIENDA